MFYADRFCTYIEEQTPEGHFFVFSGKCKQTGKPYSVRVPAQALYNYNQGQSIQEAMSMLSRGDREFLKTGYSPDGWDIIFPPDEEDDEEEDDQMTPGTVKSRIQELNITPEGWKQLLDHVTKHLMDADGVSILVIGFLERHAYQGDPDPVIALVKEVLATQLGASADQFRETLSDWRKSQQ